MHRLGSIFMILGANIAVGSAAVAFWLAAYQCVVDGACTDGLVAAFIKMMSSGNGLIFWIVIVAGLFVFWRGKRMRASAGGLRD